ncbi:hypothetical protein MLD38_017983 [Melastoma candidum]|uniref:Uncharacterized protein n=1 Tax=Melastoma candidum TaxID=119954 RepID=A0ACB9QRJ2_9MYRT|nr:hypothetical protein MLD38_017983 [Melastoma candidum]
MDHLPATTKAAPNNNEDVADDLGPGDGTYCSRHPYRSNLGGGICAFCLQEKLGKLVSSSSSFPLPVRPSASSPHSDSSSPAASSPPLSDLSFSSSSSKPPILDPGRYDRHRNVHAHRGKIPGFLYYKKKTNKKCASSDRAAEPASVKRSNTAPRRPGGFLDGDVLEYSPRKKGFWSFLYLSGSGSQPSPSAAALRHHNNGPTSNATLSSSSSVIMAGSRRAERMTPLSDGSKRCADVIPEDDDIDCSSNNFERKVSRSRSVGCGSRSFSGDFFERISTGFGDCALRRVESQREPNGHGNHGLSKHRASSADPDYCMKERVRCGGIFGGFTIASSSSSSSSSSYWITSSSSEDHNRVHGVRPHHATSGDMLHARNRSWGWAFASPMRAFSRPSPRDGKSGSSGGKGSSNAAPNLNGIPSLLAVGG